MAAPRLVSALVSFARTLQDARDLAEDANKWSIPLQLGKRAQITIARRDILAEVAFLRAFTGWEVFLEETFLLYLLGHKIPKARPRRFGFPPDRNAAAEWCSDGKEHAKWNVSDVRRRADRWFKDGRPFSPALQGQQSRLSQLVTIRNAIAHESSAARLKFENLVREELPTAPATMSVGAFLLTTKPTTTPPISFMEFYLGQVEQVAKNIVPR
jgi:hypothetical protein